MSVVQPISLEDRINAELPQTQCGKCGHGGCRPYAKAVAAGEAINRCPPGGDTTIAALARLLDTAQLPLDPDFGEYGLRLRAYIREDECIGCTKCIQACPTDAILGAAKSMHTVIESECTGCDLCVAPCPVDCIDMLPLRAEPATHSKQQSAYWQRRYESRQQRLAASASERETAKLARQHQRERIQPDSEHSPAVHKSPEQLRREIAEAVARTRARRAGACNSDK